MATISHATPFLSGLFFVSERRCGAGVTVCLSPGQRRGPDSVRGMSANLGRATTRRRQRRPADQHPGSRVRQVQRGEPGSERRQKPGGGRDGGRLAQRSEGGAVSHLLSAASDVHRRPQHCQVGALSGRRERLTLPLLGVTFPPAVGGQPALRDTGRCHRLDIT